MVTSKVDQVYDFIRSRDSLVSYKQVADHFDDWTSGQVSGSINNLRNSNRIYRVDRGLYKVVDENILDSFKIELESMLDMYASRVYDIDNKNDRIKFIKLQEEMRDVLK